MNALARLLLLLAVLAFAAAALAPVTVAFDNTAARRGAGEIAASAGAMPALLAAAAAGPRAEDLTLVMRGAAGELPNGALGASGVLAVEPLPFDPEAITVRALRSPAVGRPLALAIELAGQASSEPFAAVCTVRDGDRDLVRAPLRLGGPPVEVAFTPEREGVLQFTLEIAVGTQLVVRTGELSVASAPRVLVLDPSGVAAAALATQGLAIERASTMTADLQQYAAIFVGAPLSAPMQEQLVAAAADGMGLFVSGPGFGAPGQPLHDLLPVRPEPQSGDGPLAGPATPGTEAGGPPPTGPDRPPSGEVGPASPVSRDPVEVDKRTIALVLVVDRSGSMGRPVGNGHTVMSYAKTSALETSRALAEGDLVGLVTFGNKGMGRVELPLTDVTRSGEVRAGIERLAHGPELTCLLSGMQQAHGLLKGATASVKHVVVITDGEFDTGETMALRALAHHMRQDGHISVSILSIIGGGLIRGFRDDADMISRDGGGQFFPIEAAENVPVFVSAEVTRSLGKIGRKPRGTGGDEPKPSPTPEPPPPEQKPDVPPPVVDEPQVRRVKVRAVAASAVLEPLPAGEWPTLSSAMAATAPLDAHVLLVAGDEGWPLLAFANRGLGRVGAFAADLCGPAALELREEAAFPARLALWVQHVMRAEPVVLPRALDLRTTIEPIAPTPRDVAALERLVGGPAGMDAPVATLAVRRSVESLVPGWAFAAMVVLLLLVVVERWAALRRAG